MKIVTAIPASVALTVARDKDGAEHYLLVIKRTFDLSVGRSVPVAALVQEPIVDADTYHGDPATTSITEAGDWAFQKSSTDVVVMGSACTPRGSKAKTLDVRMSVDALLSKTIRVTGDRFWQTGLMGGYRSTEPIPFDRIPIVYERAFGGSDTTPTNPKDHRFHRENLVGVGVFASNDPERVIGSRLPNLEPPGRSVSEWGTTTATVCFGFVSPHWRPRADHAGTYDQEWLTSRYPLVPHDFDDRFYQTAPLDQLIDGIRGGQRITITGMHPDGAIEFAVPSIDLPAVFMFKDKGDRRVTPRVDTLVIRPNELRFSMVWRVAVRCVGKLYSLRQVVVGEKPTNWFSMQRSAKPHYRGLAEFIDAKRLR